MTRKRLALVLGALSIVVALAISELVAQESPRDTGHRGGPHMSSPQLQKAIDDTAECLKACEQAIGHCLSKGGRHLEANHLKVLLDCAEICKTDLGFMARGSEFHPETCRTCADICRRCAESCEKLGADDPIMKACADACRRCEESCRNVSKGTRGS